MTRPSAEQLPRLSSWPLPIDGRLYFAVPTADDLQSMVIEAKGGASVNIADVRALGDVLARDTALLVPPLRSPRTLLQLPDRPPQLHHMRRPDGGDSRCHVAVRVRRP